MASGILSDKMPALTARASFLITLLSNAAILLAVLPPANGAGVHKRLNHSIAPAPLAGGLGGRWVLWEVGPTPFNPYASSSLMSTSAIMSWMIVSSLRTVLWFI